MTQEILCPQCGQGTLSRQSVVETSVVGSNAGQVTVEADVCSFCGERWFDPVATAAMDAAIEKLRTGGVAQLTHIGELFRAQ